MLEDVGFVVYHLHNVELLFHFVLGVDLQGYYVFWVVFQVRFEHFCKLTFSYFLGHHHVLDLFVHPFIYIILLFYIYIIILYSSY